MKFDASQPQFDELITMKITMENRKLQSDAIPFQCKFCSEVTSNHRAINKTTNFLSSTHSMRSRGLTLMEFNI